jgi:hypothetical protein
MIVIRPPFPPAEGAGAELDEPLWAALEVAMDEPAGLLWAALEVAAGATAEVDEPLEAEPGAVAVVPLELHEVMLRPTARQAAKAAREVRGMRDVLPRMGELMNETDRAGGDAEEMPCEQGACWCTRCSCQGMDWF